MIDHKIGTREEWLAARLELLKTEKELTRRSDELAKQRQELPWVRLDKEYRFETDKGSASLADLFRGRSRAPHLPLHVRPRVHCRMSSLLGGRRRFRWLRRPPGQPRRHVFGCVAGASRKAAGIQAADGVDVPLGVLAWQRLQLRLQHVIHRGGSSAPATSTTTTASSGTYLISPRLQVRGPAQRGRRPSSQP